MAQHRWKFAELGYIRNLTPGNSAGTLTILGNLTENNFGKITFELGGTGPGDYDRIAGLNNITIAGTIELTLINSFDPQIGGTFDLFDWSGLADFSGFNEATELILPTLSVGRTWKTDTLQSTGSVSVVPEPSATLLALAGLGMMFFGRRRANR